MNPQQLQLALRKQQLLFESAQLRQQFADAGLAFGPVLAAGDKLRDGVRWLRSHPEVGIGIGIALVAMRPRALLRWSRRSLLAWQALRRARGWLEDRL